MTPSAPSGFDDDAAPGSGDAAFARLADAIVADLLAADPVLATDLGDHRHDARLPDWSAAAQADRSRRLQDALDALDAVDDLLLSPGSAVDLEILRSRVAATAFEVDEVRRYAWDPLPWNPATAIHLLLSRDVAPLPDRLESVAGRLAAVPDHLATARATLRDMPRIHVETAIDQLTGAVGLLDGPLGDALAAQPALRATVEPARLAARAALTDFRGWLADRLDDADGDPRLGSTRYAAALWHRLDSEVSPAEVRAAAWADLDATQEAIREAAARLTGLPADTPGLVRDCLDRLAEAAPVTDATVLPAVARALQRQTAFVRERDLVTVPDLDVRVIEMPEFHRGVAVAYCDAPGPLETAPVQTAVAVSPTPVGWEPGRVRSFYREYNGHLIEDLTAHEAMPGHALQLALARDEVERSGVRAIGWSGPFVEGWAVYAEELMVATGYDGLGGSTGAAALAVVQLKMRLRMIINALLDVGVHADGMGREEAMDLMTRLGHAEEAEAAGKWRRALLTAAQLPTYYVGYRGVAEIVTDLRVMHPDWSDRQVHDAVLAHGSPAPRHLRALLGI